MGILIAVHERASQHVAVSKCTNLMHSDFSSSLASLAQLIRIEATLVVASILGSRKPLGPTSVSSRVLRHEREGGMGLTRV
jgi:hypothetical protein